MKTAKARLIALGFAGSMLLAAPFVMKWEGVRYPVYLDPIGIPTACYGHTGGLKLGQSFTNDQCLAFLRQDMLEARSVVQRCISAPMTEYQEAALISFAFNVGPGRRGGKDGLCVLRNGNQPRIRVYANQGNWAAACAQLDQWKKAGGRVFRGLVLRRADERALCEGRVQ